MREQTFFIDPETRQRVPRMAHTGDINYDADIVSIGSAVALTLSNITAAISFFIRNLLFGFLFSFSILL